MNYELKLGDCLEVLRGMPDNSVDSIVTDPPYGLGKEPDALKMLTDWIETGHHDVKGRGFMGKEWDAFVPQPQVWHECLRVLKPGGHLLAFAGTRTQDLMTLGLRLAGFEIRDMVAWVYGSGFPKSHNLEEEWDGWGTALKPALEPITLARKPLEGTVAANVLRWHTGALNIDGCRVGIEGGTAKGSKPQGEGHGIYGAGLHGACEITQLDKGRWPANLVHDGSEEVLAGFPDTKSGTISPHHQRTTDGGNGNTHGKMRGVLGASFGDSGSAARFFYCAKTSKTDRSADNNHPTVKPTDLMRYLCRLVTPPGGVILDPYMGSGSTGKAAMIEGFRFIGIERDENYFAICQERIHRAYVDSIDI
jgi:site-specific DNA-methyltransferase (adenine-specific)